MLHQLNVATLDLNHVRALHHLLEEAHVARAAKKLSITPAAASNALRRLRVELGDELLTRDGRGLVRTTLGEQLLEPAREVIAAAERLFAVATPFDPATFDGDVPIATSDRVAGALLAKLDASLRASAPRACLRIRSIPPDLAEWSRTTFGVVIGAMEGEALSSEVLFRERYVLLVRKGHPLLARRITERLYAAAEHVLVAPRASADVGDIDRALAARGLERRVARTVPVFSLVPTLLERSDCVATMPESFARSLPASRFVTRPAPVHVPAVAMRMLWHRARDADPRHQWLRGLVRDAVRCSPLEGVVRSELSR